jgi:very-short-patch-repair endonuclease
VRRQQVIAGYIADFYVHRAYVVIEVDGSVHLGDAQRSADAERDAALRALDMLVLRVSNEDVEHRLDEVLSQIQRVCMARIAT